MYDKFKIFTHLVSIILISSLMIACGDDDDESSSSSTLNPISDIPVGQVDTSGFWVDLKSDIPNLVYKESNFLEECSIDANTTMNEVITCIIDVNEGDMYMTALNVQYNASPNLCKHVSVNVPWHWNYSSGHGPKKVTIAVDKSGENDVLGTFDSTGTGCNVTLEDNVTVQACNVADEFKELNSSFEPKCIYDYSSDGIRPNCCFGEYVYEVLVDDDGDGGQDSSTSETKLWGGEVGNCIGGVGKTDWSLYTKEGYPNGKIVSVPNNQGLNQAVSIAANGAGTVASFSYPSNYYTRVGTPHNHDGYETVSTSDLPYAVDPIDDLDGSNVVTGNDAFLFTCLDEAFEVKHQITVYIREWNTTEEFLSFQGSNGVSGDPDVVGTEGVDCDSIFGTSCNDFSDLKDLLDAVGGSYPTDNTVGSPNTVRQTYFPGVEY